MSEDGGKWRKFSKVGGHHENFFVDKDEPNILNKITKKKEVAAYESTQGTGVLDPVKKFLPKFLGTIYDPMNPEIPVGIKIENLLLDCENASVFDFKMGTSTIHKEQKGETLKKRIITDLETTTASLGIRIAGIKVLDSETGEVYEKVSHTKSLYKEEKIKKNLITAFTAHGKLWVQGIDKVITVLQDMIE